jgi:hypothetical protein
VQRRCAASPWLRSRWARQRLGLPSARPLTQKNTRLHPWPMATDLPDNVERSVTRTPLDAEPGSPGNESNRCDYSTGEAPESATSHARIHRQHRECRLTASISRAPDRRQICVCKFDDWLGRRLHAFVRRHATTPIDHSSTPTNLRSAASTSDWSASTFTWHPSLTSRPTQASIAAFTCLAR